jgi:radical SAM-linked protein
MRVLGKEIVAASTPSPVETPPVSKPAVFRRIRIRFSKIGVMKYLSHLEMLNLFTRAIGRAGIPVRYSQGFHPHPRFSFATALSVGVESYCEQMDIDVIGLMPALTLKDSLNRVLPEGIKVESAEEIPLNSPSLSVIITATRYRVSLPDLPGTRLEELVQGFLARDSCLVRREKRGRITERDLRAAVLELVVVGSTLEMVVKRGKPAEFIGAITGWPPDRLLTCRIEKIDVIFSDSF